MLHQATPRSVNITNFDSNVFTSILYRREGVEYSSALTSESTVANITPGVLQRVYGVSACGVPFQVSLCSLLAPWCGLAAS